MQFVKLHQRHTRATSQLKQYQKILHFTKQGSILEVEKVKKRQVKMAIQLSDWDEWRKTKYNQTNQL